MSWLLFLLLFFTQTLLPHAVALDQFQLEKVATHKPVIETPVSPKIHKSLFEVGIALNYQPQSYHGISAKDRTYYQNKDLHVYFSYLVHNLLLLNNGNQVDRTKAFNALVHGNHLAQYHDVTLTLLKVLQANCDNEGKLVNLERDPYLTACIYQALKDALPYRVYLDVLKAMDDKASIELLEAEQSYTFLGYYWNVFWATLNRLLNDYTKRAACTWQQIKNHPYNIKLKELLYNIDRKELFTAQEIAKHDPFFEQLFSSCCQTFIHKQNHLHEVATEQTEKLAQIQPNNLSVAFDSTAHERNRLQALNEALMKPNFLHQEFSLSKHSEKLLTSLKINPHYFKEFYGNQVQHALHKEHLQIIENSAGIYFVPNQQKNILDIIEHTVNFVNIAHQYNKAGYVQKATMVSDCCWAFLDCAHNIAKSVGKGAIKGFWQGTKNFVDYTVDHPIETLARPVIGNFILAYRLGQLTAQLIDVGCIGIGAWTGNEHAMQEWQQLCTNISFVTTALTEKCKTLSLEESVQCATAFVTEALLDYKCMNVLHKFYQTGERKTLELIDHLKNNLPPPLHTIALTPEGFEVGIAGQATAVATGNTKSVLKKIEELGGGNSLFASIEKVGSGKNQDISNKSVQPYGKYEDAPYHSKFGNDRKSKRPVDGQKALDSSVPIEKGKRRRIGISENEFVVLDQTSKDLYHGHVRTWNQLRQEMKNALIENGLVNRKGKLLKILK